MKPGATEYKYVILHAEIKGINMEFPFIFPKTMVHQHMSLLGRQMIKITHPGVDLESIAIRSAGSIMFKPLSCSGTSTSTGSEAHEDDLDLIKVFPYTGGIDDGGHTITLINMAEAEYRAMRKAKRGVSENDKRS